MNRYLSLGACHRFKTRRSEVSTESSRNPQSLGTSNNKSTLPGLWVWETMDICEDDHTV